MKRAVISLFGAMITIVASQIVALIVHQNQVDNLQAQITSVRGQESALTRTKNQPPADRIDERLCVIGNNP